MLSPEMQAKYGRDIAFRKWAEQMPPFPFKPDWTVTVIPPFCGAAVRFIVERDGKRVSVYADLDGSLGFFCDGSPYWEIYPAADGGTERFALAEVHDCADAIELALGFTEPEPASQNGAK